MISLEFIGFHQSGDSESTYDFPQTDEPVWILGRPYSSLHGECSLITIAKYLHSLSFPFQFIFKYNCLLIHCIFNIQILMKF